MLIAALFLTNIYRAATQSISHDEGVIFEWLLSGSWSQVLGVEHWNHHVLSDLLCKFTLNLFGPSEIAYRIPALLGGLLYFYSVFQISALLFPEGYLRLWSVAFLSMNPLVLDYLCCARGYGPGLGLFMYALYQVARFLAGRSLRDLNRAGVALGLSIGSNIIMMFPGGALAASLVGILAADALVRPPEPVAVGGKKVGRRKARKAVSVTRAGWAQALLHFVVPAVAIGGFISALPQRLIELVAGYTGPPSLRSILEGLVRYSLLHSPWSFAGLLAWFPPNALISIITVFFVPAGLAGPKMAPARPFRTSMRSNCSTG